MVRKWGLDHLPEGRLTVRLNGAAGQSLGAFAVKGLTLDLVGEANDYVGKGLSGATIVVRPADSERMNAADNAIIGNTVLYGATSGKLYAAGLAGERFAVRNSGAEAVIEGCGANGCEYMTGGSVAILGVVGDNFGAGMTGGMAFVWDPDEALPILANTDTILLRRVASKHWEGELRRLVETHFERTHSARAEAILQNWDLHLPRFWQIVPKELESRLAYPLVDAA
jgi:glutamate synthase (NADPH/NADH) large chain